MKHRSKFRGKAISTMLTLALIMVFGTMIGFASGSYDPAHAASENYLVLRDDTVQKLEFGSNNTWEGSPAQTWCTSYYNDNLAGSFSEYIAGVDKTDPAEKVGEWNYGASELKGASGTDNIDKVFFLSAKEYATYNGSATEVGNINATSLDWWLRSPCVDDEASDKTTFTGKVKGSESWPPKPGKLDYHRVWFDDPGARPALYLKSDFFKAYKDDSGIRYWTYDKDASGYTATTDLEADLTGHTNKLLLNDSTYWTVMGYKAMTPNPITIAETQSVTKTQSTSAQTETLAEATDAQGEVTYEIESQKKGSEDVAYFTLNGTTLSIGANTPVGTYTVVVKATAAGNDEYAEGSVTSTVTVTITKPPVTILVDAGTGHGELFTDEVLADMVSQTKGFASATREGDVITIGVTDTSMTEYELLRTLDAYIVMKLFEQSEPRHNDEVFITTAPQSVDKYSKYSELSADIKARKDNPKAIEEGFTAYMLWATKYSEEITLTAKAPVAGGDPKDYLPETPEGIVLYEFTLPPDVPEGTPEPPKFNFWTTNTTEPFTADPMEGTFAAGDEYACVATPDTDPESANWARYLDPGISIKVDNVTDEVVGERYGMPSVSYKVTVAKVDVTGITLNKDKLTLEKEADETLEATVAPTDASKKTVTWKSSDEDVATVDENGKVTAVAVGTATITATATNGTDATDDDKTATCTVIVTGKSFNITKSGMENGSVTVMHGEDEISEAREGEKVTLTVSPAEGYLLNNISVTDSESEDVEITEVKKGEEYTFTMPASDVTVSATFKKAPVTVKVDVGEGHAALFTSDVLNQIKEDFKLSDVTISGNIITLKGVDSQKTEGEMQNAIWSVIDGLTDLDGIDNGDYFLYVGYKPIDDYATEKEYEDDVYGDEHYETPISDGMTFYALWQKPYTKLEIDNGNPKCGMNSWKAMPNVPEGIELDPENSYWKDGEGEFVESFKGGNEYTFNGQIYVYNWSGDYWKYYFNSDNFTMTVKDAKDFEYNFDGSSWIKFSYKATVDHDWGPGEITKPATETSEGEITFKCKHYDTCKGIKTEVIPKKAGTKPVLVAKGKVKGKKAVKISWNKVSGADRYVVYMTKCKTKKFKKIKTTNASTLKMTKKKLKKNTYYKFYVVAQQKSGSSYKTIAKSKQGHFITAKSKGKYTNARSLKLKKSKLTITKGKSATIKATVKGVKKGKKQPTGHAAKLRYTSNNPAVAAVNAKGKVTAKSAGTATIYVQTINGIWKTCKVTVK